MTSEISSERRACIDCIHCEDMWGTGYRCFRPLALEFDMVKGWTQPTVNLACKTVRQGVYENTKTPVPQAKLCGEQAIHFQSKPVLPPEVVTKGIKEIPVHTGITFSVSGPGIEKSMDNRVFWCVTIAALAFGGWLIFK